MTRSSRIRLHVLLLGGVIALTAMVRVPLRRYHATQLRKIAQMAAAEGAREMEASWKALPYADVSKDGFAQEFVARLDWRTLHMSDVQSARLRRRLSQLLSYLQNPTFEDYYKLKTEGLQWSFTLNTRAAGYLPPSGRVGGPSLPPDTKGVVLILWDSVHGQEGLVKLPGITGVCLESVAAMTGHTNSPGSLLQGKVGKAFTVAQEALDPGFHYANETAETGGDPREPLFIHLSFFAKTGGSGSAGPLFITLGWLPRDQEWALQRMLSDRWLGFNTLF